MNPTRRRTPADARAVAPRPRGRPRSKHSDAAIRQAAWTLLAELGYENLSFEAIAEMAGCGRATLYRRFASKADLVVTLLQEHSRELLAKMRPQKEPRASLLAHAHNCAEIFGGQRGQAWRNVGSSAPRTPELQERFETEIGTNRNYYYKEFRRLVPGAAPAAVALATNALIGGVVTHVTAVRRALRENELEALVDAAIGLLRQSKTKA